jgi:hypothetical protein
VPKQRKHKQAERELPEDIETEVRNVHVVFGQGAEGKAELWLGVKTSTKSKGNVRLQFIEEVKTKPGMYLLTGTTELFTQDAVEHTFEKVEFIKTTTYKLTAAGKRQKTGKEFSTLTKAPLDQAVLADLLQQAAATGEE